MTEETKPGDATAGTDGDAGKKAEVTKPEEKKLDLTQEQFDAIIADRIKRAQPNDYEGLKAKAARLDEIEESKKTDEQKARDEKVEAEKKAAARIAVADARLRTAAILTEATKQNAVNPATVARLLATDEDITVEDDGTVAGADAAVKKLLKEEPYLVKGKTQTSGGEFGGNDNPTLDEKIQQAEAAKDKDTSLRLKIQKGLGIQK